MSRSHCSHRRVHEDFRREPPAVGLWAVRVLLVLLLSADALLLLSVHLLVSLSVCRCFIPSVLPLVIYRHTTVALSAITLITKLIFHSTPSISFSLFSLFHYFHDLHYFYSLMKRLLIGMLLLLSGFFIHFLHLHSHYPSLLFSDPVGDPIGRPSNFPDSKQVAYGAQAMVSCDVPLCSTMGKQILLQGGNAADAAVTVALCIGSVNSHLSGIGGGAFIISSKGNDTISIDARETASRLASKPMFDRFPVLSMIGGLAVAVPGELKGLDELYRIHGSGNLSWAQLIAPVIDLNEQGWPALEIWVRGLTKMSSLVFPLAPVLADNWDFIFKTDDRQLVQVGDVVKRPNLAHTLQCIANNGSSDIFYDSDGDIVRLLVSTANELGGALLPQDFASYTVATTQALSFDFNDNYTLYTTGGSSSGLALIAGINFYDKLRSLRPMSSPNDDILATHRVVESMKWLSLARSFLGDHNASYFDQLTEKFTSAEWAADKVHNKYSDHHTFPWENYEPQFEINHPHGTAHFSVVDTHGNAVGVTTTVNLLFGSMVYDNATGVILNDEMDDFSSAHRQNAFNLTPSIYNYIRPHKRPLSLMAPTIVKTAAGDVELVIGAAGGLRIPTAIFQAVVRRIYQHLPLLDTILRPRLHHQLIPHTVAVENYRLFNEEHRMITHGLVHNIQSALTRFNHEFLELGPLTAMNAIGRFGDGWHGVADYWRKRGAPDGY